MKGFTETFDLTVRNTGSEWFQKTNEFVTTNLPKSSKKDDCGFFKGKSQNIKGYFISSFNLNQAFSLLVQCFHFESAITQMLTCSVSDEIFSGSKNQPYLVNIK